MPVYEYQCGACSSAFEKRLAISNYDEPQSCPECSSTQTAKQISMTSFVLKGDGWAGKNNRIKSQMAAKNRHLDQRTTAMKHDAPVATLAPNVEGEQTGSWAEAQKLAGSKGKDTSSYEAHVRKEKSAGGTA
jgi:putative FmdB family regulatory protein